MFGSAHEDRTITATPRRLAEARSHGHAPRSRQLTAAATLLAVAAAGWFVLLALWHAGREVLTTAWRRPLLRASESALMPDFTAATSKLAGMTVGLLLVAIAGAI